MFVAAGMDPRMPLGGVGAYAARVERLGYDALHVPETIRDSMVVSALALGATSSLVVRTGVTVAFARSPMQLALSAWSLAEHAPARFSLGLGSQIRRNVERRYAMAWSSPAVHLADYVAALRACFAAFATGGPLDHAGPVYRMDHLPTEFRPDGGVAAPDIWLGAVNAAMCRVAGAVADGVLAHPTNSGRHHVIEVMRPAMAAGADEHHRDVPPLVAAPPIYTGGDAAAVATARRAGMPRLAFVLSTPAYEPTLRHLGHGHVAPMLRAALRADPHADLASLLPDEVVDALALVGTHAELPAMVAAQYGDCADGILLRPPIDDANDPAFAEVVAALRAL